MSALTLESAVETKRAEDLLATAIFDIQERSKRTNPPVRYKLHIYRIAERYYRWTLTEKERVVIESPACKQARSIKECVAAVAEVLSIGAQAEQLKVQVY